MKGEYIIASRSESLMFYRSMTTDTLRQFLPHARQENEKTRRRLDAVRQVLAERKAKE